MSTEGGLKRALGYSSFHDRLILYRGAYVENFVCHHLLSLQRRR
jgi:hypothetical protein